MMLAIDIKNLGKKFGHHVIFNNFDLKIEQGELVAIMGKSGSGKSTLLSIIGLMERPDEGSYRLFREDAPVVNSSNATKFIRHKISYIFQNYALVETLTVKENLLMALKYVKLPKTKKETLVYQVLSEVDLAETYSLKIAELSGGEQQRIAIARAILKPSDIVLADEPTGSLDTENSDKILEKLVELNKEKGKTLIIVTHDIEVANRCDRIIYL